MDSAKSIASCWYLSYLARSRISGASSQMTLTFSAVTADMDSVPVSFAEDCPPVESFRRLPLILWRDFVGNLVFIEQPKHAGSPAPAHKRGNTAGSSIDQSIREDLRVTCFIQTRWEAA